MRSEGALATIDLLGSPVDRFDGRDDSMSSPQMRNGEPQHATPMSGGPPTFTLSQDEFPIPGTAEPCRDWNSFDGYCLSTTRSILYTRANNSKQLMCGKGHLLSHEGKTNIPSHHFGPGGEFANVLPEELAPDDALIKKSRWAPPRQALARLQEFTSCARCAADEFNAYGNNDTALLWEWVSNWAPELEAAVHAELAAKPGAEMKDWFLHSSVALRKRVIDRVQKSILHVDHGIPKKLGDELWLILSADERRFVQHMLLFKMCKRCNGAKSAKLIPRDELVKMYALTHFGTEDAARQDTVRWALLNAVLDKAYAHRALG